MVAAAHGTASICRNAGARRPQRRSRPSRSPVAPGARSAALVARHGQLALRGPRIRGGGGLADGRNPVRRQHRGIREFRGGRVEMASGKARSGWNSSRCRRTRAPPGRASSAGIGFAETERRPRPSSTALWGHPPLLRALPVTPATSHTPCRDRGAADPAAGYYRGVAGRRGTTRCTGLRRRMPRPISYSAGPISDRHAEAASGRARHPDRRRPHRAAGDAATAGVAEAVVALPCRRCPPASPPRRRCWRGWRALCSIPAYVDDDSFVAKGRGMFDAPAADASTTPRSAAKSACCWATISARSGCNSTPRPMSSNPCTAMTGSASGISARTPPIRRYAEICIDAARGLSSAMTRMASSAPIASSDEARRSRAARRAGSARNRDREISRMGSRTGHRTSGMDPRARSAGAPRRSPPGRGCARACGGVAQPDSAIGPRRQRWAPTIRLKRQLDGHDLDVDAMLEAGIALRTGQEPDPRIFRPRPRGHRDLAVLLLLDTSESTRDRLASGASILDVERLAVAVLAEAMSALGDPFCLLAFASNGRDDVEMTSVKAFDETLRPRLHQPPRRAVVRPVDTARHRASPRRRGHQPRPQLPETGHRPDRRRAVGHRLPIRSIWSRTRAAPRSG